MKALRHIVVAGNILAASFLIWFGMWLLYLEPPYLSYPTSPFKVQTPTIKAGNPVLLEVERCSSSKGNRSYITGRTLVSLDDHRDQIELASVAVTISPGCHTAVNAISVVPVGTQPGRYYLSGVAEIQGTIRTHVLHWESVPFEVVP